MVEARVPNRVNVDLSQEEEMDSMDNIQDQKWKTRLVEGEFPDRRFDIEFWQQQGDEAILERKWSNLRRKSNMTETPMRRP